MLTDSVLSLNGIGEKRAKMLNEANIYTVADLLEYFPRTYEDRTKITTISETVNDETVCIRATVFSDMHCRYPRKGLSIYTITLSDGFSKINAVWFNNKYVKNSLKKGETYIFYGKIKKIGAISQIENPVFEPENKNNKTRSIIPIYPLCGKLTQNIFVSSLKFALPAIDEIKDPLPESLKEKYDLQNLNDSILNIHFPKSFSDYEKARHRIVFDELFFLSLALLKIKSISQSKTATPFSNVKCIREFIDRLPFELTDAQKKVINEIAADLKKSTPMNRLVQGDVGSGKTVVSAAAIYAAVSNGYQAALMAPTEILAKQHYESFKKMFENTANICLLSGSMTPIQKQNAYEQIKSGNAQIIIGTHALIQKDVEYNNLRLVITDEQHRFGVKQRELIAKKGKNPHMLVMSATPIPRTLALILYGDMDISVIDTLPPGRKPVKTYTVDESMRTRLNGFIQKNISDGRQIYIVCPLVEESENADLQNVTQYTKKLKTIFPNLNISLLHGKQKSVEKEDIMSRFKNGEINILVSTTVIEVGVDVANANVMIIENAERFGLAQLHQLRGRVGRGKHQSFCILVNQSDSDISKKRMNVMCNSTNGFYISEQDLILRGTGDFFGVRQHGLPSLKTANLFYDIPILKTAQAAAKELICSDPELCNPENVHIRKKLQNQMQTLFL